MSASVVVRYGRSPITGGLQSYDLKVEITESTDMPKEILVFQRGVAPAPGTGEGPTDLFICIADPVDLEQYPVNTPDMEDEIPYYRASEATLRFRCMEDLEETYGFIQDDIAQLIAALQAAEAITVVTTVTHA